MKISVTVDTGSLGVFSGTSGKTSVSVDVDERMNATTEALNEIVGAATIAATTILAAIKGEKPTWEDSIGEDSEGSEPEPQPDPEPEPEPEAETDAGVY